MALVQAAIEAYDAELAVEQTQFYASAAARAAASPAARWARTVELRYRGQSYSLKVYRARPSTSIVWKLDGVAHRCSRRASGSSSNTGSPSLGGASRRLSRAGIELPDRGGRGVASDRAG